MQRNPQATLPSRRSAILMGAMPIRRCRPPVAALAVALASAALAACGGVDSGTALKPRATAAARASASERLAKAPAPLRANAADADTITGEGKGDLEQRLAKLRGHPVVVNQWASWCGPCRAEFPLLADAVVEHGDKVAFVGIDFTDSRDDAVKFIKESPPGFASISDPKGEAARSLGGGRVAPTTFFLGPDGKRVYTKFGGYADAKKLEADIQRYALGNS
jgi:cytochrome c biogenesis protein CcmG/thiol:disulfide interchange protein DsbE